MEAIGIPLTMIALPTIFVMDLLAAMSIALVKHYFLLPLHYAAHVHHTWHLRNCVFHQPGHSVMFPLRFQSVEDIVFIMYHNYLDLIIHFKTDVTWLMFPPTPSTVTEHL
jgi:hypothetical protein